jgi:hypothetical protein
MDVRSEGIREVQLRTQVFRDVTLAVSLSEWFLIVGTDVPPSYSVVRKRRYLLDEQAVPNTSKEW